MSSYLHGQREALKTQCWEQTKTQNESKTLEKTWRTSSQCNIPQCKYPSFILNIHFFLKTNVTESTNSRKKITVLFALTFVQIETLNHAPTTPTHTKKFIFWWKNDKKSQEYAVDWHSSKSTRSQINVTISKIVLTLLEFSHNFKWAEMPFAVSHWGGHGHMGAKICPHVFFFSKVGVYTRPLVCKRELVHLQV